MNMDKISTRKFWFFVGKELLKSSVNIIKNKTSKIYNNLKEKSPKLKIINLFEDKYNYFENINITLLEDGNFILFDRETKLKIINGKTFKIEKIINYNSKIKYICDLIALNKKEILFCNGNFNIGYIEFDNNYDIKKKFIINHKNNNGYLDRASLKLLKNGKIVYMGSKSIYKKEEDKVIGLTKIYILKFDKFKNDLFIETVLNAFKNYFYEIRTKHEYFINLKKNFVSVLNSRNLKIRKDVDFNIYDNMKILNDKYFIQGNKHELFLYDLESFNLINTFLTNNLNDIIYINVFDNNKILTFETQILEHLKEEYFIKKWEFNEKGKEIKCIGYFEIEEEYVKNIINEKNDIYLLVFSKGFRIIEIIEK